MPPPNSRCHSQWVSGKYDVEEQVIEERMSDGMGLLFIYHELHSCGYLDIARSPSGQHPQTEIRDNEGPSDFPGSLSPREPVTLRGSSEMTQQLEARTEEHVARLLGEQVDCVGAGLSSLNLHISQQQPNIDSAPSSPVPRVSELGIELQQLRQYWHELHEESDRRARVRESEQQEIWEQRAQAEAKEAGELVALVQRIAAEAQSQTLALQERARRLETAVGLCRSPCDRQSGKCHPLV